MRYCPRCDNTRWVCENHGAEHDKQKFEMPARDAQLLDFSLLDIAKRVKGLREILEEPEPAAMIGGNECA
jgi:hypothetical protein